MTNETYDLRIGDTVRLVSEWCENESDRNARFTVVELRGTRVLIALKNSGMAIVPTENVSLSMVMKQYI